MKRISGPGPRPTTCQHCSASLEGAIQGWQVAASFGSIPDRSSGSQFASTEDSREEPPKSGLPARHPLYCLSQNATKSPKKKGSSSAVQLVNAPRDSEMTKVAETYTRVSRSPSVALHKSEIFHVNWPKVAKLVVL